LFFHLNWLSFQVSMWQIFLVTSAYIVAGVDVTTGRNGRLIRGEGLASHGLDASRDEAPETTTAEPEEEKPPPQKAVAITTKAPSETQPHLLNTVPPEEDASKAKGPFHPDQPLADPTYSDQKTPPAPEKPSKDDTPVGSTAAPLPEYKGYVPKKKGLLAKFLPMLCYLLIGFVPTVVIMAILMGGMPGGGGSADAADGEKGAEDGAGAAPTEEGAAPTEEGAAPTEEGEKPAEAAPES
jgi:hypothetical protein